MAQPESQTSFAVPSNKSGPQSLIFEASGNPYAPVDVLHLSNKLHQFAQSNKWPLSLEEITPVVSRLAGEARVTRFVSGVAIKVLRDRL